MMQSSTVHGREDQMWLSYSWHSIHHRVRGNGQREWEETQQHRRCRTVGGCMGCKTTQDYITLHS